MTHAGGIVLCGGQVDADGRVEGAAAVRAGDDAAAGRPAARHRRRADRRRRRAPDQELPELPAGVIVTRDEHEGAGSARRAARRPEGAARTASTPRM